MDRADQQGSSGLGIGLPRCLSGWLELQKRLYLSGPRRHSVLRSDYVRSRVAAELRAAADEVVIVAFYGDPENRRELWNEWRKRSGTPASAPARGRASGSKEIPPSLEYCILDKLDRDLLQSAEADEILIDRLEREVRSGLDDWSALNEAGRIRTVHLAFAQASLRDDRSILGDAVQRVDDLSEEFDALLRAPTPEDAEDSSGSDAADLEPPETLANEASRTGEPSRDLLRRLNREQARLDSAFQSVHGLVTQVEDAESLTVFGGFATDLEQRVEKLQANLTARRKELESRKAGDELLSAADRYLGDVSRRPAASGIQGDLEGLADTWRRVSSPDSRDASRELSRLHADVPAAIEALEQACEAHCALEEERKELREFKPTSRQEQRDQDDRLDALRDQSRAARDRHREAEDTLLAALAPTLDQATLASDPTADPAAADDSASLPEATVRTRNEEADKPREAPQPQPDELRRKRDRKPDAAADRTVESRVPVESQVKGEVGEVAPQEPEAEAPPPKAPRPKWTEDERSVRNALASAWNEQPPRLAQAFHICRLAEELEIAAGQPPSAVVEAALYASRMRRRRAPGELSSDLSEVIESAASEPRAGSTPEQQDTEALIRFAGALAPALLAPHTGAAAWLKDLDHEKLPALYRFAQQAAERSWAIQSAPVGVRGFLRQAGRHMKQEDAIARLQQALVSWKEGEATLPLGYVPANKVWAALLKEDPLGGLIGALASQAAPAVVRAHLAELEDRDKLRKRLDELGARLLRKRQTIDAKVFKQIRRRLSPLCELAHEYLSLVEATTEQSAYHRQAFSEFVGLIRDSAPSLRHELDALSQNRNADPLVRAATEVAKSALIQVENLVGPESGADDSEEPATELIRASGLFLHPDIRIDDAGFVDGDAAEALKTLASSPAADMEVAIEGRLSNTDLRTAEQILDWSTTTGQMDAERVEKWKERLRAAREDLLRSLAEDVETLQDELETAYLYGRLEQEERSRLATRLTQLEEAVEHGTDGESTGARPPSRFRFDQSIEDVKRLRSDIRTATEERLKAIRDEARERLSVTDPDRLREVERHIDDGDLVAANELIFRPEQTPGRVTETSRVKRAPEDRNDGSEVLDSWLAVDRAELRAATENWAQVVEAAKTGRRRDCLAFDELEDDDRAVAGSLLEGWSALKRCAGPRRGRKQQVATATREFFSRLGFLNVRVPLDDPGNTTAGAWAGELLVDTLADREHCAVAQFGSLAQGRYPLLVCFEPLTGTQILQRLSAEFAGRAAIVVCLAALGERSREQIVRASFEKRQPLLVLDSLLLAFLAAQDAAPLATFFALSLPFSWCKPFQSRASFVPPELFFGREQEKREILDFHGACFLYGGRQLGKTAVLRRVQEEFTSPKSGQFAIWVDLKSGGIGDADTADIWGVIWHGLRETTAIDDAVPMPNRNPSRITAFCEALHQRFNPRTKRKLLILLDEADNFLRRDALNSNRATFSESSRLKDLMDRSRSIKVVFAGLHNVLRTTSQSNHPLAHLGTPICIGPFIRPEERRQAESLLGLPLQACGFRFEPARLLRSVLARTNYYPSLLQIYGDGIAERLSRPDRRRSLSELPVASGNLLEEIHRDRDFQKDIRNRFDWTLQLDARYEAIAYALAHMCREDRRILLDGADARTLFDEVRDWWRAGFGAAYDIEQFRSLVEEMIELGVLRRLETPESPGKQTFSLRNPNVLALLGTEEAIAEKLLALGEQPAPVELGPREIRRRDGEKGPLHRPLTLQQEHEIAGRYERGAERNEVVVVCGAQAAGASQVAGFLLGAQGAIGHVERLKKSQSAAAFERSLRSCLKARKQETTVLLCDTSRGWSEERLDIARSSLEKLRSRDRIVRIVFPLNAKLLMTHRQAIRKAESRGALRVVGLRPWSIDFAARCLDEDRDVGGGLNQKQERDLAGVVGGWPVLLERVLGALRDGVNPATLTSEAGFRNVLLKHVDELQESFGLTHSELAAALRLVHVHGTAAEDDLLDPEARELAGCSMGDEELRSAIWAAGELHLLRRGDAAEWAVDPVVATVLTAQPS